MGKIEIDHTGSGSGVTVSSDGTDLLLDGTAIGGGGGGTALELYGENPSSPTAPDASGTNAVAIGTGSTASGTGSIALGTSNSAGTASFAAAIAFDHSAYGATGAYSASVGQFTKATGSGAMAFGGTFATASGSQALAIGRNCVAAQQGSVAMGQQSSSVIAGKFAYSSSNFAATGDSQLGICVLRIATTDATPKAMLTDNPALSASATNQIVLPNSSAYAFHGTIVARQQASAGTACAAWKIEGLIRREGGVGTTVLVNSATTVLDNTPSWGMALTADTAKGGLAITVTGAASTNIRWVATVNTSEVTY
ncbi:MAG: hypothetical protein MUQ60_11175 [Porticoccaceae bacterium]|nr:hypothetical protein [Porticoccaceae bacterium]